MSNKKEMEVAPLFATDEQKAKGFCDESWIIISASSDEKPKAFYFNPSVDPEEFEDFKGFVESQMEDFYCPGDDPEINKSIKDNYATVSGYTGSIEDDYDEESGKSSKIAVGQAAIMEFHKGGINQEKLADIVKNIKKDLENLESQGAAAAKDSADYHADPYKYYGLKRSDFF